MLFFEMAGAVILASKGFSTGSAHEKGTGFMYGLVMSVAVLF